LGQEWGAGKSLGCYLPLKHEGSMLRGENNKSGIFGLKSNKSNKRGRNNEIFQKTLAMVVAWKKCTPESDSGAS